MLGQRLAQDFDLALLPGVVAAREGQAWLADWRGIRAVLRGRLITASADSEAQLLEDVAWQHAFLASLAGLGLGFPSPRPLPAFGGQSWTVAEGLLWEIVSFIPGHAIGWDAEPPMDQIGAMLARYHAAARRIRVTSQRPGVIPLADVPAILLSRQLDVVCPSPDRAAVIRRLAGRLAADLDDCGHYAAGRLVIHGDFTSHNVIADGIPPRVTGVIDFHRAHLEAPLADIASGLWRSGRPRQDADYLDLARVRQFVRGYASTLPLPPGAARALPAYLYGRGLQMIAKRVQGGQSETGMLARAQWIAANAPSITVAVAAVRP
jgi:Ser/Thr protein kinase RdoA (MazF antagonist)